MEHKQPSKDDRCVICGAPTPEGRMICFCCENSVVPVCVKPKEQEEKKDDNSGR